jgi:PhoH-like ATPase
MRKNKKLFVLDTNVLISDPSSIFKFQEHDVFIPFTVLEELDKHKKGQTEISRNARQASRTIESVINNEDLDKGFELGENLGRLFFSKLSKEDLEKSGSNVNDNIIISQALIQLESSNKSKNKKYSDVVLVSKDINVRIKGSSLGMTTEDYENDYAIKDNELLSTGIIYLDYEDLCGDLIAEHEKNKDFITFCIDKEAKIEINYNNFVCIDEDEDLFYQVISLEETEEGKLVKAKKIMDYTNKSKVWGIKSKNLEQNLALNLLLDPSVSFVTLLGPAGTGKTLLTLAAGLEQVLDENIYSKILITRATVTVGEEIGFLPGTEEEKMAAWMGNMYDNLEALMNFDKEAEKKTHGALSAKKDSMQFILDKIEVKSIGFMRGRSFQHRFIIIDEAQNLSPKAMRMLLTRAGEGTKIVCMGNLAQIDTPYMTENTSGLTHVVKRMQGWNGSGSLILNDTVRSPLAEQAEQRLRNS